MLMKYNLTMRICLPQFKTYGMHSTYFHLHQDCKTFCIMAMFGLHYLSSRHHEGPRVPGPSHEAPFSEDTLPRAQHPFVCQDHQPIPDLCKPVPESWKLTGIPEAFIWQHMKNEEKRAYSDKKQLDPRLIHHPYEIMLLRPMGSVYSKYDGQTVFSQFYDVKYNPSYGYSQARFSCHLEYGTTQNMHIEEGPTL